MGWICENYTENKTSIILLKLNLFFLRNFRLLIMCCKRISLIMNCKHLNLEFLLFIDYVVISLVQPTRDQIALYELKWVWRSWPRYIFYSQSLHPVFSLIQLTVILVHPHFPLPSFHPSIHRLLLRETVVRLLTGCTLLPTTAHSRLQAAGFLSQLPAAPTYSLLVYGHRVKSLPQPCQL